MMAQSVRHIALLILVSLSQWGFSQGHLFSEVKMDREAVYLGQPVQVRVGVFTSTWFTSGINPGNIKVNGAFTVYFRSVSQSRNIDGKTYAGVELIFNVFPYDDQDIIFPALEFEVETPDDGGYKGIKRTIKTRERTISVKPMPRGYDKDAWLVASGMTVSDNWTGNLKNVKVGDVLERTISRNVSGTVPELIPPIAWDTLQGASLYPSRSEVNSEKTKTSISASRTEGMRYLFEKEGTVLIPELVLTWWNPDRNKLYKRTLKSYTIEVLPNPELGMLESLRDSLAVTIAPGDETAQKEAAEGFLGLSKRQWISLLLGLIVVVYVIFKILKWLFITKKVIAVLKKKREAYLQSERYYFRQFKRSAKKQNNTAVLQSIYHWIDVIHLKEPTMQHFARTYGNADLVKEADEIGAVVVKNKNLKKIINIKNWSAARKKYLKGSENAGTSQTKSWINPLEK